MNTMIKKVAFVTTARSDYSTMYPVMRAAIDNSELDAKIFCGGMHLLPKFGETFRQLEDDNIPITEKLHFFHEDEHPTALCDSIALGVQVFTKAFVKHDIDMVVVSGDRVENLALLSAATCLRMPICHLCGGDITEGAFDNQVRHTMTKLSHLHMVSMQEHYDRVVQMGEEPWRVAITGDAALDTVIDIEPYNREELAAIEDIPAQGDLVLCTFHPLTLGSENFKEQFSNVLAFLASGNEIPVITYPNIDPGFDDLIQQLNSFLNVKKNAILKKSFTRRGYYSMMYHAQFMVGNSSSGLWEAPSFRLPCINVGTRQSGRKRSCNVIDVCGDDLQVFKEAKVTLESHAFRRELEACENPYGTGHAAEKTISILKNTIIDDRLMVKKFFQIADPLKRGGVYG